MHKSQVQPAESVTGQRVPALEKGVMILELLGESKRGLTLSEIARRLDLPKSSTHCLLVTLRSLQYVVRSEKTGRYHFGARFFRLSKMVIQGMQLRENTATLLRGLHEATHLTVHLAVLDHDEAILIDKVGDAVSGKVATWIGRRMEVHCTSLGKAILAFLPEEEVERQIGEHGLPKHNENTLSTPRKLRLDLEKTRTLGFALDDEEDEIGFRCIAAPVFDHERNPLGAVSVAGTVEQLTPETMHLFAALVKETASSITELMSRS
jgi:DNA-binding IclR family transcriptional regulator